YGSKQHPSMRREVKTKKSRSSRAGLLFPVSRIERQLRRGQFAERFGACAPVYLAAVLQWATHKTVDMAGKISKKSNQQCISPQHLQMSVKSSSILKHLLGSRPKYRAAEPPGPSCGFVFPVQMVPVQEPKHDYREREKEGGREF
uniref:Histone H2A n=1 Tax=Coturnix japonica TaxID=93934 RepID=A0A8C2U9S0_COTJA